MHQFPKYPKIENVWYRNPNTGHQVFGLYRTTMAQAFSRTPLAAFEKVNGMSIRIMYDGETVRFGGRTDRAVLPGDLVKHLEGLVTLETMKAAFDDPKLEGWPGPYVCIYGEGFGPGIQKAGSGYGGAKRFIAFDMTINGRWLDVPEVQSYARFLGIETAPFIGIGTMLEWTSQLAQAPIRTRVADRQYTNTPLAEGVILRPPIACFDNRGKRVIFKLKTKDVWQMLDREGPK